MERVAVDPTAYRVYRKLRDNFPEKVIRITQGELVGIHLAFKDHREFIAHKFKQEGVEVTRWAHKYDSLKGANPELGLVYLASDSILDEAYEVHALIGHNAKYLDATGN